MCAWQSVVTSSHTRDCKAFVCQTCQFQIKFTVELEVFYQSFPLYQIFGEFSDFIDLLASVTNESVVGPASYVINAGDTRTYPTATTRWNTPMIRLFNCPDWEFELVWRRIDAMMGYRHSMPQSSQDGHFLRPRPPWYWTGPASSSNINRANSINAVEVTIDYQLTNILMRNFVH